MALSYDLLSQFAKITRDKNNTKKESSVYGTIVKYGNAHYVKLDGSDLLTPYTTTVAVNDGDRVLVKIKNHSATVTGSTSNPSASNKDVVEIDNKINKFEIIVADKVTTQDIEAVNAYFENIKAVSGKYEDLAAITAEIETLQTKYAEMEYITAADAEILNAEIESLQAKFAEFTQITTEDLEAVNAEFSNIKAYNADFTYVSAELLEAMKVNIEDLDVNKLDAESASIEFANIDFSNIGEAAIEKLFSDSGIIKDLIVNEGKITGELVGVTIKGDLIEGNTIVADKLVVMGEDGLYYKLNIDGLDNVSTSQASKFTLLETEPDNWETNYQDYYVINENNYIHVTGSEVPTWQINTYYKLNSTHESGLDGSVIIAKSITADRVAVTDLVAFGATIGGFNITENSIYSGVKESVNNTTRGVYIDNDGQIAFGDANNYLKYYKDENGEYKLAISFGNSDLASVVNDVVNKTAYITMATDEYGNPCIELGKTSRDYIKYQLICERIISGTGDLGPSYIFSYTGKIITADIINSELIESWSINPTLDTSFSRTDVSEVFKGYDADDNMYYYYQILSKNFKVRITNSAIDFMEDNVKIAYANNNTFCADKMIVKEELKIIGEDNHGFVWKVRKNGNMGLVYIE